MWIVLSVFLFMMLLVGMVFILPTQLILQSDKQNYCFRIPYYFSIRVFKADSIFRVNGKIFFIPFTFSLDDFYKEEKEQNWTVRNSIKLSRIKFRIHYTIKLAKQIYKAVTIHHLYVTFDTGDYPLNAQLIPIASVLQKPNIAMQVNFVNRNWVDALIYTRLYKIVWILFKHFRTKK